MKKKLVALLLVVALLAIAITGATLAYFSDEDAAENVFIVGNIDIQLHEANQAGDVDEDYQEWLADQLIMPGIQRDKIVTVENVGKNDAYVRVTITVPKNMNPIWNEGTEWVQESATTDNDGTTVYVWGIPAPLAVGKTTSALLLAMELDKSVTEVNAQSEYDVIVKVEAIQAESFADYAEAFAAFDDATYTADHESAGNIDTLIAGLAKDNTVVVMEDHVTSRENLVMGSDTAVLDGNGYSLTKEANTSSTNAGVETTGGAIKNIEISGVTVDGKGFRAIYVTNGLTADLTVEDAVLNGTYAINITATNPANDLFIRDSKLNGWVSFACEEASFTDCAFVTADADLQMFRAYNDANLTRCSFTAGYKFEAAVEGITIVLNDCEVNGTPVTAANFKTLFNVTDSLACTVIVDGATVS